MDGTHTHSSSGNLAFHLLVGVLSTLESLEDAGWRPVQTATAAREGPRPRSEPSLQQLRGDGDEDEEAEAATGKRAAEDDEDDDVDTKKQKTDEDD